jgi:hypothetical protein
MMRGSLFCSLFLSICLLPLYHDHKLGLKASLSINGSYQHFHVPSKNVKNRLEKDRSMEQSYINQGNFSFAYLNASTYNLSFPNSNILGSD